MTTFARRCLMFLLVLSGVAAPTRSQTSYLAGFQSLYYPRSVSSGGIGEITVTSPLPFDAMIGNPANLARANGVTVSFFRNPWQLLWFDLPFTTLSASWSPTKEFGVGVEFVTHDFPEWTFMTDPMDPAGTFTYDNFERSLAVGVGYRLWQHSSVGASVRYVWMPVPRNDNMTQFLFSAGISHETELFGHPLDLGLSLMEFGSVFTFKVNDETFEDSPPASLHAGVRYEAISGDASLLTLSLAATRPIVSHDDPPSFTPHSSFAALFRGWSSFPNDVTARAGLTFAWRPVPITAWLSYTQEASIGLFSVGPADFYNRFFTHAFTIGLRTERISLTLAYAGRWHNANAGSFLQWEFPWETVQATVGYSLLQGPEPVDHVVRIRQTILSLGVGHAWMIGKMKELSLGQTTTGFKDNVHWSVEADVYYAEDRALVTAFGYSRYEMEARLYPLPSSSFTGFWTVDLPLESVSLESGMRYHPLSVIQPLFVEGTLGIVRFNPVVEQSAPRYFYNSFLHVTIGAVVRTGLGGLVFIPRAGIRTTLMLEAANRSRLGGYNQLELGLRAGLEL